MTNGLCVEVADCLELGVVLMFEFVVSRVIENVELKFSWKVVKQSCEFMYKIIISLICFLDEKLLNYIISN